MGKGAGAFEGRGEAGARLDQAARRNCCGISDNLL
jgi:hypothetical protein